MERLEKEGFDDWEGMDDLLPDVSAGEEAGDDAKAKRRAMMAASIRTIKRCIEKKSKGAK